MAQETSPPTAPGFFRHVAATSFDLWRRQFLVVVVLTLVVHCPRVAAVEALQRLWLSMYVRLDWTVFETTGRSIISLIDALFIGLSTAPVVYAAYARLEGRGARVGESLRGGLFRRFLPVLRVSVFIGVLTATATLAANVWLATLVRRTDPDSYWRVLRAFYFGFPLVVALLLSPFWVAVPAALAEAGHQALRRSWSLARGHRLGVCAILFLLYAITTGTRWTVSELATANPEPYVLWWIMWWVLELLVVSLSAVFAAVGYHALRLEKEGVDVSKLAKTFA